MVLIAVVVILLVLLAAIVVGPLFVGSVRGDEAMGTGFWKRMRGFMRPRSGSSQSNDDQSP